VGGRRFEIDCGINATIGALFVQDLMPAISGDWSLYGARVVRLPIHAPEMPTVTRTRGRMQLSLWIATLLVVAALAFDYIAPLLLS
jgi:hypothetical protein